MIDDLQAREDSVLVGAPEDAAVPDAALVMRNIVLFERPDEVRARSTVRHHQNVLALRILHDVSHRLHHALRQLVLRLAAELLEEVAVRQRRIQTLILALEGAEVPFLQTLEPRV